MTSREKILNAAIKVIAQKGIHGTKMEEVAAEAGLNKAMVYYIFSTKDNLYFEVLKTVMGNLLNRGIENIKAEIDQNTPPLEIIKKNIRDHFYVFQANTEYTKLMLDVIGSGLEIMPKVMQPLIESCEINPNLLMVEVIERGKKEGSIRKNVDAKQLVMSIHGMTSIYFMTKSMGKFLCFDITDEEKFLEERMQSVIDLIINGIKA